MPTTGNELCRLLDKFRDENSLTWAETAARIGISETYLHRVRAGKQMFSRKVMNKLTALLENSTPYSVKEKPSDEYLSRTTQEHIIWLEDQLGYARTKEERLLKIIENACRSWRGPFSRLRRSSCRPCMWCELWKYG